MKMENLVGCPTYRLLYQTFLQLSLPLFLQPSLRFSIFYFAWPSDAFLRVNRQGSTTWLSSLSECSKLLRLPAPTGTVCKIGVLLTEANMGRFTRRQNVERYWRLLDRVTNEPERQRILELLVEERQKQKDAGDELIW
jgi:hypothetical protein